jgi:hypothetical protein
MNSPKIIASLAIASALALGFTSPAAAASFSGTSVTVGPDNGTWEFNLDLLSLMKYTDDVWYGTTWDGSRIYLFDSTGVGGPPLGCSNADLSDASDASGDKVLTCETVSVDNGQGVLTVTVEWRFYAAAKIVRQRLIVTNDTPSTISAGQVVSFHLNSFQDNRTQLSWVQSTGILDDWSGPAPIPGTGLCTGYDTLSWATDDRQNYIGAPVVKYAIGRANSVSLPISNAVFVSGCHAGGYQSANDESNSYFTIPQLAAAETVEFVVLHQQFSVDAEATPSGALTAWETGTRDAIIEAHEDTALTDDAVVFAGIADRSRVVNWSSADDSDSGSEGLANTGAEASIVGLLAVVAFLGTAAVVVRRREVN